MNITQQEQKALFTSKLIEGKDEKEAQEEIFRDMKFLKDFKEIKTDKERILRDLNKEIDKRTKQIKSLEIKASKLQNQAIKSISQPKNKVYAGNGHTNANVKHLWRIIRHLEHNKRTKLSLIPNICMMNKTQVIEALNFLTKTNLIKEINERGCYSYER